MKLSQVEVLTLVVIVAYVAFFTHPVPEFVKVLLDHPLGHALVLLGVLGVSVKVSLLAGLFTGIAYVMSTSTNVEFLDPKEQAPKDTKQPVSAGVSAAAATGILKELLGKGGKIPSVAGKSVTSPPPATIHPKPAGPSKGTEHFSGV